MKDIKKISILFFSHSSSLGGAERSLLDLIIDLKKTDRFDCFVMLPKFGKLKEYLEHYGAKVYIPKTEYHEWVKNKFNNNRLPLLKNLLAIDNEYLPIIKEIDPDLIYTQTITIPWGAICAKKLAIPHILSAREYGKLDHNLSFEFGLEKSIEAIYADSSKVLCVTSDVKKILFSKLKDYEEKCNVIYSSIHIPQKILTKKDEDYLINLKKKCANILVLGTIADGKNQIDAVRAVIKINKNKKYKLKLFLVGIVDDNYKKSLKKIIRENDSENLIIFQNFSENNLEIIRKSDIVISCARREAFGRNLLEAAILNRPIIYANSGGSSEIFIDKKHGLAYNIGDHIELSEKIINTIDFLEKTRRRVNMNRIFVIKNFASNNYIEKILPVIEKTIDKKNKMSLENKESAVEKIIDNFRKKDVEHLVGKLKNKINNLENIVNLKEKELSFIKTSKFWKLREKYISAKNIFLNKYKK